MSLESAVIGLGDSERRLTRLDHDVLRLWLRLMSVHKFVAAEIRRRLQAEFNTTFARFDLMAQLEREPAGLRMIELSRRLMVTSGNVTQITDQLERDGIVERLPDPQSRRACLVRLTPTGRQCFAPIALAHKAWIVELFSGLTSKECRSVLALLAKEKAFLAISQGARNSAVTLHKTRGARTGSLAGRTRRRSK